MTKAYLKTGSLLEKPKSINVFRDGDWHKEQMGYVYYQGLWVPFVEYKKWLYNEGVEHIPIVRGYLYGGAFSKEEDHISLKVTSSLVMYRATAVTDSRVDFTGHNKLYFEAYFDRDKVFTYMYVSDVKSSERDSVTELTLHGKTIGKGLHTFEVDVSEIIGEYYIKFQVGANTESKLYKIWLE